MSMEINTLENEAILKLKYNKYTFLEKECSKILCKHCKRTKDNGLRCIGICVSDNDY